MRVASLLPSATEILAACGAEDLLIARSHECDRPPGITRIPPVTRPRLPPDADPREIDDRVRHMAGSGEPIFRLDVDRLATLRPDIILTQGLCRVCAVHLDEVRALADRIGAAVVDLNPTTLESVLDDVLRVGAAVGREREAIAAVHALRARIWRSLDHVTPYVDAPVVGFLEWTDPLFIAGHWTVQLIERAGGRHPLNETVARPDAGAGAGPMQAERVAGPSIAVPPEVFAATRPSFLVISPCGLDLDAARACHRRLLDEPWYRDLPAVRSGRVAIVDGHQMFNRPGPRLVDALEFLVGWLGGRDELIPRGFPWEPGAPG